MDLTATSSNRRISENLVWSGRFHFAVDPECDIDYLRGRLGGYVTAICEAESMEEFLTKAFNALRDRQLTPDDEFEEIEDISLQYENGLLSEEWMALCRAASQSGLVTFNDFDLYVSA